VPFAITKADIMAVVVDACPVLGITLDYVRTGRGLHDNSPTLDRIVNERGYVPGNVLVVSFKVNRMKQNATVEELETVARFYRNCYPSLPS
jgi:hypothetical protein